MIQIYQPQAGKEELKAIKNVFKSNWLGKGPITDKFIKEWQSRLISDKIDGIAFASPSVKQLITINFNQKQLTLIVITVMLNGFQSKPLLFIVIIVFFSTIYCHFNNNCEH